MLKKLMFIFFLVIGFVFVSYCYGDVPNEIRYNGKLKEYRAEVNGTKQMNFKLYSELTGGTALWESGTESVKVSSGIFTYIIKPDNTKVDWRNKDIYLEIEIDGKKLEPREKILAVPYSLHSNTSENILVVDGSEFSVTVGNKEKFFVDKDNAKFIDDNGIEFYMVPKGAIIIWSGSADNIPKGWALCDGTKGTPDLRDRFVLCAGDKYSVGMTGGEEEHTLTIEEIPNHSHKYTNPLIGDGGLGSGDYYSNEGHMRPRLNAGETITNGGDKAHNNMPPYYSLCYIMKIMKK